MYGFFVIEHVINIIDIAQCEYDIFVITQVQGEAGDKS